MPKNWCPETMMLKKNPLSPLDSKETKPVNLKGDQRWLFTGRAEAEALVFWWRSSWCWERRGAAEEEASEDETAGRQHRCDERELGKTPGDGEGQGGLACCSPWGRRVGQDWVTEQQQRILHVELYVSMLLSPPPPLPHAHKSVLYVCFSTATLQINPSVPSF